MYKNVLVKMREKIRKRQYVMTLHANEEMENDALTIFDVEHCILSGEIIEKQKDRNTNEWKYVAKGECYGLDKNSIVVVGKISVTDKFYRC